MSQRFLLTRLIPGGAIFFFLVFVLQLSGHAPNSLDVNNFRKGAALQVFPVTGFANYRIPDGPDCDSVRIDGALAASQSIYLDDDTLEIATSLEHPAIDYKESSSSKSFANKVKEKWASMSGSSVWLEKYGVYMTVTRVFFYADGVKHWSVMSFIRARLYDENWIELKNHTLSWKGSDFTFPRTLDIDAPWWPGDIFFGPEDPRIIIEQDVEEAEPVIVFNMIGNLTDRSRSMHVHHPFSNFTTKLEIKYQERSLSEKNWAPFFVPKTAKTQKDGHRYPNEWIHFVYQFTPMKILKCHLYNGACTWQYAQPLPETYKTNHKYPELSCRLSGGTNFVPVPAPLQTRPGLSSFIGIPRTHCDEGCEKTTYRPAIMVLTTNGTVFWLDYMSEVFDFGTTILTPELSNDACLSGRIMMANSIARVYKDKRGKNKDVIEVTYSVADSTVQVGKIQGISGLIASLPQFEMGGRIPAWEEDDMQWNANVTHDILTCSVATSAQYAIARAPKKVATNAELLAKEA